MKSILILIVALTVFASTASAIPSVWGVWNWTIIDLVHIVVTPQASGTPLTEARHPDGSIVDATIRIQLWVQSDIIDPPSEPQPVAHFPAEDIWLEMPGLAFCIGGVNADDDTDEEGWFTFTQPLGMGGWSDPPQGLAHVYVMVNGAALIDEEDGIIAPTIQANSPDLNGDLVVNLQDVTLFAEDYFSEYTFRSDLFWDGTLNLSDLVWLSVTMGEECP